MILWTAEAAAKAELVDRVIVVTDAPEIEKVCTDAGIETIMTGAAMSGTDRIAQALKHVDTDVVVNVQGDEPLIQPSTIDAVLRPFCNWDDRPLVVSAATRCRSHEEFMSPDNVKVVVARDGEARYFSRAPIPWADTPQAQVKAGLIHKGIYAYWKQLILQFASWEPAKFEQMERLEQLRFVDRSVPVTMMVVEDYSFGIDTPDEAAAAATILAERI